MPPFALTSTDLALLRAVRLSDEDHGGLASGELAPDEHESMDRLLSLDLVEAIGEYGEAPDGEEDEWAMGASALVYRITGKGVVALRDEG